MKMYIDMILTVVIAYVGASVTELFMADYMCIFIYSTILRDYYEKEKFASTMVAMAQLQHDPGGCSQGSKGEL